jgi:hypothetical protein
MSKQEEIKIVLGNKKFAGASNKPLSVPVFLGNEKRDLIDGTRSDVVNLLDLFNEERVESTKIRISGKITNIFDNSISGKTSYVPFRNNLYYVKPELSVVNSIWKGYPQYDEFTFIRQTGIPGHVPLVNKNATTYNWGVYVSYVFNSTTAQTMSYYDEKFNVANNNFNVASGIPYVIKNDFVNGRKVVLFYCSSNHNLNPGEYVYLSTPINGKNVFLVDDFGDGTTGTEKRVFSILNLFFNPTDVLDGNFGNFKRISRIDNSGETISKYYIRLHKIISTTKDTMLIKNGFENNPFPIRKQLEYSALTPNSVQRISTKDNTQTFGFSINKDINVENLKDNLNRPITELFVTIINKGYMGWFNKPATNTSLGLDIGWEFNFSQNVNDTWWNHQSSVNKDNIYTGSYVVNNKTFYYNQELSEGQVIKGDFCEYNQMEQKEYVISPIYHKYSFNIDYFDNIPQTTLSGFQGLGQALANQVSAINYPLGYTYKPHYSIKIKEFSPYIEQVNVSQNPLVPDYAFFSENDQRYYWRDIYDYGFLDNEGNGIDRPFLNGFHYHYKDVLFLQYPMKRNTGLVVTDIITPQITDDCE